MPLPTDKGQWPPKDVKPYIDQATKAGAWWSGDRQALQDTAGVAGDTARRRFWQRRKTSDATKATPQLHAPLAADIASVSADMLFGDPVGLNVDDTNVQAQIEAIEENIGLANRFVEAAETCAATGGVYLRAAWDETVADHSLLQIIDQRHAVPDFRYGVLVAVTLWEDVLVDGTVVWRHLERHERGVILHGLYQGTLTELGTQVPLAAHPATADLEPTVRLTGLLADRLLVSYVPNVLPNRTGSRPIGRPDWAGCDDFLDALDETWTSLMRDVRLGQAHVFVPQEWLKAAGGRPGTQVTLDVDQELFTGLNVDDSADQKMETYQAALRVPEHIAITLGLTERIVSAAGYSPQSFGLQIEGRAESGTSLRIREGKTTNTRQRKQRYFQTAIRQTVENLLAIDADLYAGPRLPDGERVKVDWPELARDPAEQATWIQTLRAAQAMSIENAVKAAQPDLDEDQAAEEVDRIKAETTAAVPDPFPMG